MKTLVLGIDPGNSGGIAFYCAETKKLATVSALDSAKPLSDLIKTTNHLVKFAVVEEVGAMTYIDKHGEKRGQGAAASFSFGKNAGVIEGILTSFEIPIFYVKPAVWKALMGLTSNKGDSLNLARTLFPAFKEQFKLKKHDGLAEAALLAKFGAERFKLKCDA